MFQTLRKALGNYVVLALVALYMSSCAAILSKREKVLVVTSSAPGTKVYVNDNLEGETPLELTLRPNYGKEFSVEGRKEGYPTRKETVNSKLGIGWVIADVLLTGLLGIVIDGASGAWLLLDTKTLHLDLQEDEKDSESSN